MESILNWVLQSVDHPIHFVTEIILVLLLFYLYSTKSYKPVDESLTNREEEELINEWTPEPLVSASDAEAAFKEVLPPLVEGPYGPRVKIEGEEYLNFASHGFLGYQTHPEVIDTAIDCTNNYGVGACGPRGFYGSIEPLMDFEKKIAKYMGTEDSVMFSSDFQNIGSVIPAFAKPGDFLVCDKGVSFAIQYGISLSRSTVKWFNHNDMHDLQRVLQSLTDVFNKKKHKVFVVVESIYVNHGDLLDLKALLQFKEKYPFRIILEESLTIGVLGKTGRGLTEHIGVPATKVEIIAASIGNALGSVGGFACGTTAIANHMRLNCSGYVFSCSSPPYVASACSKALELLSTGKDIKQLQQNIKHLHNGLATCKYLVTPSSSVSPYIILRLAKPSNREEDEAVIQSIIDALLEHKIIVAKLKYSKREAFLPEPQLKLTISVQHTLEDINTLVKALNQIVPKKINF
jgi:serine palmitoyltransferase